nr:hypothetical protein [Tanacetum cinerariifolium]
TDIAKITRKPDKNGHEKGKRKIDKTLFIKRHKVDILLVQVYADDIIFNSTKKELCISFEKLMHKRFQMSFIEELTFFLGLQVKQKKDGTFISQDKYVAKIFKKFKFIKVKTTSTPMETQKPLLKDKKSQEVDVHMYRYLKGQPKLGLWYPKDSLFDLVAYANSDYAGASLDMKSTTGDEAVYKELGDSLVRAVTTSSSLETEQDNGGGPKCQETMRDATVQTRFESVSRHSNDSLLAKAVTITTEEITLAQALEALKTSKTKVKGIVIQEQEEPVDATQVSTATTTVTITTEEITLAQALEALKTSKPKVKGIVIQEQEQPDKYTTTTTTISPQQSQDKAALKLQAMFDDEERLAREKAKKEQEANIALIETWDGIQAKIDKRRKHFAAKRAKEKKNKPLTQAQQRKITYTYLKNMEGYKLKYLKLKEFESIKEMVEKEFRSVNTFEDFRTLLVKRKELIHESTKNQKVEYEKETAELKQLMKIILDKEEVAIDVVPLALKSLNIVDWKIYKE